MDFILTFTEIGKQVEVFVNMGFKSNVCFGILPNLWAISGCTCTLIGHKGINLW